MAVRSPYGDIICDCGNDPSSDGLYPADPTDGHEYDDAELDSGVVITHYRCASCGLVHEYDALPIDPNA